MLATGLSYIAFIMLRYIPSISHFISALIMKAFYHQGFYHILNFLGVCCYLPLFFLILLIWVFSLCLLVRFSRGLSILFIFSNNQFFVSLIVYMFCLYFVNFGPYFDYFSRATFEFSLFLFF
jgi:hypothetical protein